MPLPLESVPNFSAGRDEPTVAALRRSLSSPARLVDVHVDLDHNRSVFTLVGSEHELVETLRAGIRTAVERVDLSLEKRELIAIGPPWLRGWEPLFFAALLLCAIPFSLLRRVQ